MRRSLLVTIGCVLVGPAVAAAMLGGERGRHAVAGPLYVAVTGADGPCTQAQPCGTLQQALERASPGQTVLVQDGHYPDQTLAGTKGTPSVVFQPAPGANVFIDDIFVHASNVELRSFHTGYWASYADSNRLVMRNIDTGPFIIFGSANTSVIGGDVGPSWGNGSPTNDAFITYGNDGTVAPSNVLIDHVYFHDFKLGFPGDHGQCLQVVGGVGLTIRNSRFQRCDVYSIFFTQWAGPDPPQNILLENNFFDQSTNFGSYTQCCTYYAVQFSSNMAYYKNIIVRYNSALQELSFLGGIPATNVQVIANVAPNASCVDGLTYLYNVFQGQACGATNRSVSGLGFVDPTTLDLHPKPTSPARNHGDPKNYPRRDIDGHRRPLGKRVDAGAAEIK